MAKRKDVDLTKLIAAINETWPNKKGEYTTAIFFRHDKAGNILGSTPLVGGPDKMGEYIETELLLERLRDYRDVLERLQITIFNKILNDERQG